ncbi:MAG: ChbG/HpnK family deacetylase [Methylobacter sp.]
MLIVNADDLGRNNLATERILECYAQRRITSATAMVFMDNCERASDTILESGIDLGLHLNFTSPYDSSKVSHQLIEYHNRIATFLLRSKYSVLLYNPLLRAAFDYTTKAQHEEFERLFGKAPTHVDGHHHMHLCMNMLAGGYIPHDTLVRRSFSFRPGEKSGINRLYRQLVDYVLTRHYRCVDSFFTLKRFEKRSRLNELIKLSYDSNIEVMVHPENSDELFFLMSDEYSEFLSRVKKGTFSEVIKS